MASSNKFVGGLPTTQVWDPSEIEKMDVNTPEFKRFLLSMHQNMNSMAMAVNEKASGTKSSQDMVVGQVDLGGVNASTTFPSGKTVFDLYRKVINYGPIENEGGGIKTFSVPHGIPQSYNGNLAVVSLSCVANHLYGAPGGRVLSTPIPFIDTANVELFSNLRNATVWLDGPYIILRLNGSGSTLWRIGFNHVFVIVEYIYVPY